MLISELQQALSDVKNTARLPCPMLTQQEGPRRPGLHGNRSDIQRDHTDAEFSHSICPKAQKTVSQRSQEETRDIMPAGTFLLARGGFQAKHKPFLYASLKRIVLGVINVRRKG